MDTYEAPTSRTLSLTKLPKSEKEAYAGWLRYAGIPADRHDVHVVGKTPAHLVLPWIHQIFSNLKGWARGVYHGLRRKNLQPYLDEFVFRFNRRKTRHAAFRSLLGRALKAKPTTYNMLIKPELSA